MSTGSGNLCEDLEILTRPTEKQIMELWESRLSIPEEIQYAFADASPTRDEFLHSLEKREIICFISRNREGNLVSAIWLHDLERNYEGVIRTGWLGGYAFPNYRGSTSIKAFRMMLDHTVNCGIRHIHTAIHIDNRKSIACVRNKSMLSFTYVCQYADWTTFGGCLSDAIIMTRDKRDKMLAWLCAQKLASKRLLAQDLLV